MINSTRQSRPAWHAPSLRNAPASVRCQMKNSAAQRPAIDRSGRRATGHFPERVASSFQPHAGNGRSVSSRKQNTRSMKRSASCPRKTSASPCRVGFFTTAPDGPKPYVAGRGAERHVPSACWGMPGSGMHSINSPLFSTTHFRSAAGERACYASAGDRRQRRRGLIVRLDGTKPSPAPLTSIPSPLPKEALLAYTFIVGSRLLSNCRRPILVIRRQRERPAH
jgi:hypothetical protein